MLMAAKGGTVKKMGRFGPMRRPGARASLRGAGAVTGCGEETIRLWHLALAISAAVTPAPAAAQDYPAKPVPFVVPYAPAAR